MEPPHIHLIFASGPPRTTLAAAFQLRPVLFCSQPPPVPTLTTMQSPSPTPAQGRHQQARVCFHENKAEGQWPGPRKWGQVGNQGPSLRCPCPSCCRCPHQGLEEQRLGGPDGACNLSRACAFWRTCWTSAGIQTHFTHLPCPVLTRSRVSAHSP